MRHATVPGWPVGGLRPFCVQPRCRSAPVAQARAPAMRSSGRSSTADVRPWVHRGGGGAPAFGYDTSIKAAPRLAENRHRLTTRPPRILQTQQALTTNYDRLAITKLPNFSRRALNKRKIAESQRIVYYDFAPAKMAVLAFCHTEIQPHQSFAQFLSAETVPVYQSCPLRLAIHIVCCEERTIFVRAIPNSPACRSPLIGHPLGNSAIRKACTRKGISYP